MAHDTVFSYKGKPADPRKVSRDLNVEAVVTGQVLQRANTLIVRVNLMKADGSELWGNRQTAIFRTSFRYNPIFPGKFPTTCGSG